MPILMSIVVLLVCASMFGCAASQSKAGFMPPNQMSVRLATVKPAVVEESSDYAAVLKSRKSVSLYPRVDGHVTKVLVTSGDTVTAKQPLLEIDPLKEQHSVASFGEAVHSAKADLQTARETLKSYHATRVSRLSNLHYAQRQLSRYTILQQQGAVAMQDLDQWINQSKVAEGDLQNVDALIKAQESTILKLERALKQAEANLRVQQEQLSYHSIRAPFPGMVGDIPVKLGDYVSPTTKLTAVTQNKPLEVYVSVPTEKSRALHLGMNIQLIDGREGLYGNSKVFFIAPSVDESSQSILVKSYFPNTDGGLRADQLIKARVIWSERRGVLVPTTAISHAGGQDFVFIAENVGQEKLLARQIPVKLGDIQGNNYQVLNGVKPGDRIVISGIQNLMDGVPIAECK
jgi:multidrug efflux pump subunit AcrA (membrane-fusion protein)